LRILLVLLILPILLLVCALLAYRVPLPAALSGSRDLVAAITAGLAGAGYLLALVAYLLVVVRRSSRALDPVLEPLGLVARGHLVFGRRYAGVLDGRPIQVRYLPAQAMWPARLDLTVESGLGTRMAVGSRRPLLDCRDCLPLHLGEDLPYRVYAQDQRAARDLFADRAVRAIVDRLMDARGGPELYVQPGRTWFRVQPRHPAPAEIKGWLSDLVSLSSVRS
jgi:hypothetical protein